MKPKHARLCGKFKLDHGKTVLCERYHEAPIKISKTFEMEHTNGLMVYIMDASPGILDGDRYEMDFHLGKGCHAFITNQSYTKVHPAPKDSSVLKQTFTLEDGSFLELFPEPLIPYKGSRFTTSTQFHLQGTASLFYGDIITPGRTHYNERFLYDMLDSRMEAYRDGQLAAWDRFLLMPGQHRYQSVVALQDYTHMGSLWIFSPQADEGCLSEIRKLFPQNNRLLIGASLTADRGILIRMLGNHVWEQQQIMREIHNFCRQNLLGLPPHLERK